jgi:hypothetical protein
MYDIMVVLYRLGYPERLCSKFHSAVTWSCMMRLKTVVEWLVLLLSVQDVMGSSLELEASYLD